ncbi:hypothetical protein ACFYXF_37330 [Streptomyces sp. NPDC002680]|uniref:hypothetical protein n=1 Tax=Streptomyces sp. NPDC002680 TaxID=3364659 RepID=UPI0036A491C8
MNRPLRRTVFATAALTAGLLMTACQSGTDDNSSGSASSPSTSSSPTASSSPSSSATTGTDSASGSDTSQGTQATPPGSSDSDSSDSGSSDSDSSGTVVEGLNAGKGVSGTWFGNVSYLAPGKYTVSDSKGTEQQFFTAEDTKIIGYDDICDAINTGPGGEGGVECTEAQLEKAAKKGFSAEVVISNGIATSIRDDN